DLLRLVIARVLEATRQDDAADRVLTGEIDARVRRQRDALRGDVVPFADPAAADNHARARAKRHNNLRCHRLGGPPDEWSPWDEQAVRVGRRAGLLDARMQVRV